MEVLRQFKECGYFTSQLYHLMTKKKLVDPSEEIIPSEYLKEMRLSTVERLQKLNNIEIDNIVNTGTKKTGIPVLSFTPRIIVFQNFKPNEKVVAKFTVKNISKATTFLNMVYKESSNFFIKPCGSQLLSRLAPGISVTFAVTFESSLYEDYVHKVMFHSDTDHYVLPLIAMGPRPMFDFPDQVILPKTPLKIETFMMITVHNVGVLNAGFTIKTRCPFNVHPKSHYVLAGTKVEFKVGFRSMHLGNAEGELRAVFETGEVFRIRVLGEAHSVSIELEKQTVRFLDTYNTMVRQQTFKITNKSDHLLTYMCMKNEDVYDDFEDKLKFAKMFYDVKQNESLKYAKLVQYDVLSSDEHERVYTRIFTDEIQAMVTEESMLFQNMHFAISPNKGQLWPKKVTEITIIFSPKEIGEREAVCYLDIDGISNRVPLKIVGTSIPPLIHLNLETLDMDRVYINKLYNYEIVAMNKGHISGLIVYNETPTLFGSAISCTPLMHCLAPGEKAIFIISFSNPNQGCFFEEINFVIRDTSVVIRLYLKGEIVYPTMHFSKPCLDFGTLSVGIPVTLELEVINESEVRVRGSIKISSDGPEVNSLTLDDCESSGLNYIVAPQWPREFHIEPSKIDLDPESKVILKVTLTANLVRANQTCLEVEMEKSDSPPITLPVSFNAVVPEITPAPDVNLRALFVDYPYKHDIIISSNEFWGYFSIKEAKDAPMEVEVEVKHGIIKPNSSIVLPATIRSSVLGPQEHSVRMFMFGLSQPIDICYIKGCACRPIVTCTPNAAHLGQVKALTRAQKTITMNNDSPIRVYFRASMLNRDGRWTLDPQEGYLEPEGDTELTVSVYLTDACTYSNKAVIQLDKVKDLYVPVTATGTGTSIVVGEERDRISLGRHFIKIPLDEIIVIMNLGNRLHSLEWTGNYKIKKNQPPVIPFFNLEPRSFKLAAGEKIQMKITGLSSKVTTIQEIWYLVGNVEGVNKKELLLECPVVAEFVEPRVELSSVLLNFRYDYGPYCEYYKLTDILTIKNVSKLGLMIDLNVRAPFAIVQKKESYLVPSDETNLCCCICYDESDLNVSNIINESGLHQSKTFIDCLTNQPVEPLRDGPLHFFHDIHKIKQAFYLTHTVEQRLEDQEVMKVQIIFDTTKHLNLKCKVYNDVMRIKFRDHKNKDAVKLVGSINFPNMLILTPKVDFGCILNDTVESRTIRVHNITPLNVCYKFQWKKCQINKISMPEKSKLEYIEDVNIYHKSSEESQVTIATELNETEFQEGEEVLDKSLVSPAAVESNDSEITKSKEDINAYKRKIMRKIAPMLRIDFLLPNPWTNKFGRRNTLASIDINDIFLLLPHRGLLKPRESQDIQVIFNPSHNVSVKATLECEILGGPSEYISIMGQSSDLMYTINTQKLNFKIRSFHEHASEILVISNIAQLSFEYKTYLNEPSFENELPATIVNLVPSEKTLEPEEEVSMSVLVRPGVVGYFHRTFLMEIGHFPAMPIEIFGWGVVPQVYLCLPRPQLFDLPPILGYLAIPSLTSDYLGAINEIFTKGTSEHLNSPQVEQCLEDPTFKQEWHVCTSWDEYPSKMDIELALERMLVINHIKSRPEIMNMYTQSAKMGPIPGFTTIPYVIDFGVVITGSIVQRTIEVKNYGPIAAKLHFSKSYSCRPWLNIKLCGKLEPGDTGRIEVTFSPTPHDFKEVEQNLELMLYLEVPYGVVMPIQVKALCAVPYLKSNVNLINLGKVRCGDKIISSIPLRNVGKPTCIWYATLKLKTSGPNPIEILDSSGKYEPGEGGWLNVSFKPTIEMTYEAVLIFRFHMNPTKMTIPVIGQGLFPHVHIIGPKICFPPTLPWSETTDMYFGITNPCSFPIELIVAHTDSNWKEEEDMFNLLYKYYNKPPEILLPIVKPGQGMPAPVTDFFDKFKANVKRNIEEETAAALKSASIRADTRGKKGKSPKPKSAVPRKDAVPPSTIRKFRSEAEIIADEIKAMKEKELDPLAESHQAVDLRPEATGSATAINVELPQLKGLLLFVHGTPCDEMECRELAYTLGMQLRIPTINIDIAFVEALCVSTCFAKTLILSAINTTYENMKKITMATKSETGLEDTFESEENEDLFEVIQRKLEFLANSKNITTPRSKASDKKKKSETSDGSQTILPVLGSTTMFNMDYTTELLSDYFSGEKFHRGFVVDSLTSQIIRPPSLVLSTLIRCKRSIQNLHLLLGNTDFNKWILTYEEAQHKSEAMEANAAMQLDNVENIQKVVQECEEMDGDEYENLNPELKQIYITHALEVRRRKHLEKKRKIAEKSGRYNDVSHKKEKTVKADVSTSLLAPSDSKRKLKKDEVKAKPPAVKPRFVDEVVNMTTKYNDYIKNVYDSLINIAINWVMEECDIGVPLFAINGLLASTPAKKAKKKSEIQIQVSEVVIQERGFPLTILLSPCSRYKEGLVNMFRTTPFLHNALKEETEFDILQCPATTKQYTLLLPKSLPPIHYEEPLEWLYLDEKPLKKCECNQITDLHLMDDTNQDNVINILAKWHCICGKKMASSQTSTSEIPTILTEKTIQDTVTEEDTYPLPLRIVKSVPVPSTRIVLQPGDLLRFKYAFSPKLEGNYFVKRYVEVAGWPESRTEISVNGISDIPRLDNRPKKMFGNFVRRRLEDTVYKSTYLDDIKMFEFGPIFIGKNRIYEEEYTIDLRNASLMTADIDIQFLDDLEDFQIDKTYMRLEPGHRDKLTITAAPQVMGVHTAVLLFCVKDNPEIVRITIGCSGVVPIVEILPVTKTIDYNKLLLYRRADDRFIVKNESILPVMWQIRNPEEFVEDFIISQTSGIIPRNDNKVVPVTYIACNVGVISNRQLIIDIYDEHGRGDPMIVDCLYLSGECYDVMIEFAYANPNENVLNFGNVKVNSPEYREMFLLNRGKYPIYYKLKKVKKFPEPALLKSFNAFEECGVIPPTLKLVVVEFGCMPTTSINLNNVPAYTCSLLDGSKEQVVVAKFPVCITIASFYNTFTLFPLGELNFNIIAVGSGVMREVILNNTSKCPFTYEIFVPEIYRVPADPNAALPKLGNNKIKNPPIKCGNFVILNEDNLLAPGMSRTIQIQFFATAVRTFEETIHFVVSDTCPAEAHGVPLKLVGTGAMPSLDFWNLDTTFREHLIVKNMDEYKIKEPSPHCIFTEDTVTLHFFGVTVNNSYTAYIDLYNNGLVACALFNKMHYQDNTNDKIFALDKNEIHVEPLLHKTLGIIFSPIALEEYRAVLEINLKLLKNEEQSFKICLIGEGVIPRIKLMQPVLRQHKLGVTVFPMTCLGSVSHKVIKFKNISSVKSVVNVRVQQPPAERPVFYINIGEQCDHMTESIADKVNTTMQVVLVPQEIAFVNAYFNPLSRGRTSCDLQLTIENNPYEHFMVLCEAEAFMEDVILLGLEMLSIELDVDFDNGSSVSAGSDKKKPKSAPMMDKRRVSISKRKKASRTSINKHSDSGADSSLLRYVLDFGGCELCSLQKRSVIMVNNSEKVFKFSWETRDNIVIKPSVGYISPGEEKDLEIMFFSLQAISVKREPLLCSLTAISDDSLVMDLKCTTWDNRQLLTYFNHNAEFSLEERREQVIGDQSVDHADMYGLLNILILYSVSTEYSKYMCNLQEEKLLKDTFIYQTRSFEFTVENVGNVPMKIDWDFYFDEEYPARIDKYNEIEMLIDSNAPSDSIINQPNNSEIQNDSIAHDDAGTSKETLFSGSEGRHTVDTWFEIDLPFTITPNKDCLKPRERRTFKVSFSPLEAFFFKVRLKSTIDNLDPYNKNISCSISAKALIPYVHLDIEESDYLTSGRRKATGIALPQHMSVLEFNVLGSGCYKKTFNVINPTNDGYEFVFELLTFGPELIPFHCNVLKGFVEGGTSWPVTMTFAPTAPGIYESQWKFIISKHNLTMNLLVVGVVREPDVLFVPPILILRNSLVGFTTTNVVVLKNNENESLNFQFKGNSMCNESGKTPVIINPEEGVLKPRSETRIIIEYTPIQDGPMSFKIFCSVMYCTKYLTLCVNALSHLVKPTVTYYLINSYEHTLDSEVDTNIHLDETVSTYERTIPFHIKNDGSATFHYEWNYVVTPVRKYLNVRFEPRSGFLQPGNEIKCTMYFLLKQVPVVGYPVTLTISDGPKYCIFLHAEIASPACHFSWKMFDFGKCIVDAPDPTYTKNLVFKNDEKTDILTLDFTYKHWPELFVDFQQERVPPDGRIKIPINFRPKEVKEYEFKLQFWVNSLCEEIITIRGEGVPLLLDLYEGCQKSFDLGPVKIGKKIIREIEVMNHSKVPIDASFIFEDMYPKIDPATDISSLGSSICLHPDTPHIPTDHVSRVKQVQMYRGEQTREQIEKDIKNALASVKVVPSRCIIKPYMKVPLKIHFKPVGLISSLNIQLNAKVLEKIKPLVLLSGSATGMLLYFSQNSLQFGRVRKRGCKILKVMLNNKGDFGTRFFWQPLKSSEFTISPMQGYIDAHTNVTFTITYRPKNYNPFVKVWASCNIENYKAQELSLYATCMDYGIPQTISVFMECPVRSVSTEYVSVTNPTDEAWLVLSEVSGGPFETLKEFIIDPNITYDIPIHFKPRTMGKHETQVLYSPLGETALFVNVIGATMSPNPSGDLKIKVAAQETYNESFSVYNITEKRETYIVDTEVVKVIPDKFDGFYEIKFPDYVQVWGEAAGKCLWQFTCYQPCEMQMKVMFINEESQEYQFYNITAIVTPSQIMGTLTFVSRARESVQQEIMLTNPLNDDDDFYIKCEQLECVDIVHINRHSNAKLTMTYSPLVVGTAEDFLEIHNDLIGVYMYKVKLTCLPAKQKHLDFTTTLGNRIPIRLRVQNRSETRADFECILSHPCIQMDKDYVLQPGEKGKFLVWFEPINLGVQNCRISFNSTVAGEFVFNIKGTALYPTPQGPCHIKAGGMTQIKFKNIFDDTHKFKIFVDNEEFYVKFAVEQIKAKKDIKVIVYLNDRIDRQDPPTGCLTIENLEPAEPRVQWTYFLHGKP